LDLQNLARRTGRPTDELHQIYALEGFLARLTASPYADRLILKGGVLLAALDVRRPTRDIDFQGQRLRNDAGEVNAMVKSIARIRVDDGLELDADAATADIIRDQDEYSGVRVTLRGRLAAAQLTFHVDVNVGDPVWPAPQAVTLPRLLDGTIRLIGYPLPMVHAEKVVTVVQRGAANTRWRDFADIYALSRRHDVDGDDLTTATRRVADYRGVRLAALDHALGDFGTRAQPRWSAWLRKQRMEDQVPDDFRSLLASIGAFADPLLLGDVVGRTWSAARRAWAPTRRAQR
jgi:hypothetical protein